MAQRKMRLETVVWDDVADTATLTFRELEGPPPPVIEGPHSIWPGQGASVTLTSPIRRNAVVTKSTCIIVTESAPGMLVYTKYEYNGTAWVSLGQIAPPV